MTRKVGKPCDKNLKKGKTHIEQVQNYEHKHDNMDNWRQDV
jgi:hypothetical protein